jgi:hypothetical protein
MADTIFRSALNGCFRAVSTPYGQYLAPARDPLADGDLPEEALKRFELHENPPVIPAELWSAWIKLCFHFVKNENAVEVAVRILRHQEDFNRWRMLVPVQLVCGASVQVETCDNAVDLITGEVVPSYPPEGWQPIGTSH